MPRTTKAARSVRRTCMMVDGHFEIHIDDGAHGANDLCCPYCSNAFDSTLDRDRLIMMKPACRAHRLRAVTDERHDRRERAYKIAGPSTRPLPAAREAGPSIRADHSGARYNEPRSWRWDDGGRTCGKAYVEKFPFSSAGQPISRHRTHPVDLGRYLREIGGLADPEVMVAAEQMMTEGLSCGARDRFLKSSFYKGKVPWRDSRTLLIDIDKLPHGPSWTAEELIAGEGEYERVHIVYKRSVIDVIRNLIGNPRFKDVMRYAPERHWTSTKMQSRVYGEMWTGNWWWRCQLLLRDRQGTIVPVIIASDKTQMTKLGGNQAAYPVYLTIGNISKSVRRRASSYATSIVGYLPIDEFTDLPGKARGKRLKGELIHRAMRSIMEPLESAGRDGVEMWCADGCLRRVYPLLAAFVGDWPEQNDMACTVRSSCPICLKSKDGRGDCSTAPFRDRAATLAAVNRYQTTGRTRGLAKLRLKPWWPWWANLPGVDFSRCITPDLLHQWHKGLFKGHAMKWIQQKIGKRQVDQRFASMPRAKDLRHFKTGISRVQQWTGRETKEMAKVFLPLLAEHRGVSEDLTAMIRAMLDFAYLAHSARLTDAEVQECHNPKWGVNARCGWMVTNKGKALLDDYSRYKAS